MPDITIEGAVRENGHVDTAAAVVVREFGNGAKILRFADDVQVGIAHDGRVYWATPAGWDFVLDHSEIFREKAYRTLGDRTGWPTSHGSEFYLTNH